MSGERILVVDDEPVALQLCAQTLAAGGYQVHQASGGPVALARLEEEQFDLLLVDLMMPKIDGLTLLRRARKLDPSTTAVIITGYGTMENAVEALQAGARGFILKPFEPDDLLRTVHEALEARRQEQETSLLRAQLPILQISQTLMAEGDTGSLPQRLLEIVAAQMKADRALLMLLDPQTGELYQVGALGLPEGAGDRRVAVDWPEEPHLLDRPPDLEGPKATTVSLPLRIRDRAIGMLALSRDRPAMPFSAYERKLLSILGGQIATSLENVRLREQAQNEIAERRQAEEALRLSEEKFAKAFRSSPDSMTITTVPEGRYVEVNDCFLQTAGYRREEVIGRTAMELNLWVDLEDRARFMQQLREKGVVHDLEVRMRTRAGEVGVVSMSSETITLEGKPCVLTISRNITDRKRMEAELLRQNAYLAALHETALGLLTRRELDELLESIVERATALMDTPHGYICLLEPGESEIQVRVGRGAHSHDVGSRLRPGEGLAGKVWQSGRSLVVDDYCAWPDRRPDPQFDILHGIVGVPLLSGSQVVGVLGLAYSEEGHGFRFEEIAVLSRFAELASVAADNVRLYEAVQRELTERERAEEGLRESEERYRRLFEDSPTSLWEEDLSGVKRRLDHLRDRGVQDFRTYLENHPEVVVQCAKMARVLDVNRATMELYQVESKEALCGDLARSFSPESYAAFREELVAIAEGKRSFESDTIAETLGGDKKVTLLRWSVVPGHEDTLARVLVSIIDITERKQAEEALRRSLAETARGQRLLLALGQAAQAVQRARTREEVHRTVCDEIAALGYQATIFTLTDDRAHLAASHLTFKPGLIQAGEKLTGLSARDYRFPLTPGGFYQQIMAEGKTVFSDPGGGPVAEALPRPVRPLGHRLAGLLGVDKAIYAPLTIGGETLSLLTVMGPDLTEADVPAMTAFASQAAVAAENAQLYEQIQTRSRYLETLQQINATLRSTLPLDQVLETIARSTGQVLGYLGSLILVPDAAGERLVLGGMWGGGFIDAAIRFTGLRVGAFNLPLAAKDNPMARAYVNNEFLFWTKEPERIVTGVEPSIPAPLASVIAQTMGARLAACVPLAVGDRVVGVLIVFSPREQLPDEEQSLLLGLANQAGLAIQNAQLYQAAQQELTERKRAEEALRLTQFAIDRTSEAAFWMGSDARFIYVNDAACRNLGYSREELLTMGVHDIDPDFPPEVWADHWREVRERGSFALESHHRTKDGRVCPVEITVNYLEFEGKEYNCAFARDTTERKQMEQTLLRTERLAAMGHLAAALAHEINNPLQSIENSMELVLDFPLEEEEREEYLEAVRHEIERLMALTSRVLDFARPPRVDRRPISVAEVVRYALTLADKQLAHSRIGIHVDLPDGLPSVLASPDQLAQVFLNLIINAIEAMPGGGELRIAARSTPERVELTFEDDGPGISRDTLARLFEPFHTTKEEGTGLGLAVSYSIIQQHGGAMMAGNAPGGGAAFTIHLPVSPPGDPRSKERN